MIRGLVVANGGDAVGIKDIVNLEPPFGISDIGQAI